MTISTEQTTHSFTGSSAPGNEEPALWIPFAEPVPDMEDINSYGFWWEVHVYGVSILFHLVSVYSLWNIIYLVYLHRQKELRNIHQTAFFIAITSLMLVFSLERAIFMLLDPYNVKGSLPPVVAYLFISVGLPCMTSCFFLIFYAFYKATSYRRLGRKSSILNAKVLITVIVLHFVTSLSLDIAAGLNFHPVILLMICQSLFIFCGLVLGFMFVWLFIRMYNKSVVQRRRMIGIVSAISEATPKSRKDTPNSNEDTTKSSEAIAKSSEATEKSGEAILKSSEAITTGYDDSTKSKEATQNISKDTPKSSEAIVKGTTHEASSAGEEGDGAKTSKSHSANRRKSKETTRLADSVYGMPKPKVTTGGKLILASAILLILISLLYLYGLLGVFLASEMSGTSPNLWLWWSYELAVRLAEVGLCWTISLAGTQPAIRTIRKRRSRKRRNSEIAIAENLRLEAYKRKSEALISSTGSQKGNSSVTPRQSVREENIGAANVALENETEPVSTDGRVSSSLTVAKESSESAGSISRASRDSGKSTSVTPETIIESTATETTVLHLPETNQ